MNKGQEVYLNVNETVCVRPYLILLTKLCLANFWIWIEVTVEENKITILDGFEKKKLIEQCNDKDASSKLASFCILLPFTIAL